MKLSRTTVSIIIAAAVLLSAYIVGLVIRQARSGGRTPTQPVLRQHAGKLTPEERAKIQEARTEQLEQNRNLTPEQQEQFKKNVARQLSPKGTPDANAPLDEKAAAERARAIARMRGQIQRSVPTADANSRPATSAPNTTGKTSTPDANRPK